ncbi:MAG: hypothetical protein A2252_00285 [Elusimicrobia bacterium RIFOXYA2_FULL_39_19]|nr:MAG: hypothetical protein A2252_00285 [Elusimicrobia bacterium RIFOXYA2_FULL_39_19]
MNLLGINIKRYRETKSITLRTLAKSLDISPSFLSQIETGKAVPSLDTLKKISDSLSTTIGNLIGEDQKENASPLLRLEDRKSINKISSGMDMYLLTSPDQNKQMEPLLFKMNEKASSGKTLYRHFGQEFVLVIKGSLEISLNNTVYALKKGDSLYFNSNTPHSFKNTEKGETEAIWVVTPPTF